MNKTKNTQLHAPENSPMDLLKAKEGFPPRPRKSVRERASFFDEPLQKNTNKMHPIKTVTNSDNKPKKVLHEKGTTPKNEELAFIKRGPDVLKNVNSAINKERIAMLTAKMERKAPPPKPPRQLSLVNQDYKLPKSDNKLESTYDAPKQPHIPHYTPFTLADLEATDSESSYSSDESDSGHEFSMKTLDNTRGPLDQGKKKKKTVSFSDKVTIIPDYIYKEEECNEKRNSVQTIMSNFNSNIKLSAKKRDTNKPIKTPPSPQRLSNKLLDFFQQKRIFTSEKTPSSNPKSHTDTAPEPLTHLTKSRPRKPSSMRKSREMKVVL